MKLVKKKIEKKNGCNCYHKKIRESLAIAHQEFGIK